MLDAYGDSLSHLTRGSRVRLVDNPGHGRESPDSRLGSIGSVLAVATCSTDAQFVTFAVKLDAGPLVEVSTRQIVEDDEMPMDDSLTIAINDREVLDFEVLGRSR